MKKTSSYSLLFCLCVFLSACQPNDSGKSNKEQAQTQHDHSKHHHGSVEVSSFGPQTPIPTVQLVAQKDSMAGWNLRITTTNFQFAPDKAGRVSTAGEGHAHLYVDGFKFARLYGDWFHLKNLTPGKHRLKVTLNTNDHSTLSHQGQEIAASADILQP